MIYNRKRRKGFLHEINPDEVLLDSRNSPNFNAQQLEGRIEKPIAKRSIIFLGVAGLLVVGVIVSKLWSLQIVQGAYYKERSENISFNTLPVFADRGVVYDRTGKELIWNVPSPDNETYSHRAYIAEPGFSHVLGYVGYPSKDSSGIFWSTEFIGKDGIEKQYNDRLKGVNGNELVEIDVHGEVHSKNLSTQPTPGDNLITTIDAGVQAALNRSLTNLIDTGGYTGGSGIIMDIHNGEILALTNAPEYNSAVLSDGSDTATIKGYMNDSRKVFMNRAVAGLYAPGSIVKPFVALGALSEGVISPEKQIFSSGSISLPNPYNPKNASIFKDWKAHGWTDMRAAIAVSSDVYFYAVGGGFQDQKGIGIAGIDKYNKLFGVGGEKTGIDLAGEVEGNIPTPEWKLKVFKGDPWRVGDTYHTAIGQYGFQVTPIQMARATAAIANGGMLVTPHLLIEDSAESPSRPVAQDIPASYYKVVQEGMREAVTEGTVTQVNFPYVKMAAKSGTAQLGANKDRINSWIVGFFPYENPKYAFAVLAESAPNNKTIGAVYAFRDTIDWMHINTPQYLE
ncbi:MAG TPA: penicillin-binding transpeptidase domain-containing protein [Candidatus Paceibacterota bacterium]|nr:penicillin-binding transpeptidase domain-containing protein [Candidatus Paceibacterota bacterium]